MDRKRGKGVDRRHKLVIAFAALAVAASGALGVVRLVGAQSADPNGFLPADPPCRGVTHTATAQTTKAKQGTPVKVTVVTKNESGPPCKLGTDQGFKVYDAESGRPLFEQMNHSDCFQDITDLTYKCESDVLSAGEERRTERLFYPMDFTTGKQLKPGKYVYEVVRSFEMGQTTQVAGARVEIEYTAE